MNMMKKMIMAVCAICIFSVVPAMAEGLQIMTEDYPPFNYTENGQLSGLSTEVVQQLAKKVGNPGEIEEKPWARAYALIQKEDGFILYSMTRTESRENMFKWVGPVASNKWVFFAKKGSGISLASLDDAKKVGKIGTYKDDAAEIFLKEQGFTNLDSVVDDSLNVPKLMAGRVNLWVVGELQGIYKAKLQGVGDQLEKVMDVKDTELYIAFSKNTPDDVIVKWQAALDEMKADGSFDALVKKYM
ncbi:polar amino acid transport system substrate-binding protein [Desulfopila aestuarii DSM 18488]|uniref:Polar amino acid transport system substrate-binding protein n=2 Tax=Desulfopila aestuarii TaxID=231440 RepID=A0A1M7YB20_9BACT|nr:polar amino acid transport system substrate-binding protein [Desulfopila aestuarii DSM 18488]